MMTLHPKFVLAAVVLIETTARAKTILNVETSAIVVETAAAEVIHGIDKYHNELEARTRRIEPAPILLVREKRKRKKKSRRRTEAPTITTTTEAPTTMTTAATPTPLPTPLPSTAAPTCSLLDLPFCPREIQCAPGSIIIPCEENDTTCSGCPCQCRGKKSKKRKHSPPKTLSPTPSPSAAPTEVASTATTI